MARTIRPVARHWRKACAHVGRSGRGYGRGGVMDVNAPDLPQGGSSAANGFDITCSYANLLPLVADAAALVRKVALLLSAGQVSAATQTRIVAALNATPVTATSNTATQLNRVAAAVLLVMASPEYLVQK